MSLQAMTKEKLQFLLPVVFTVGPEVTERVPNAAGLLVSLPRRCSRCFMLEAESVGHLVINI